ncbi:TPA: hypothetical protein ACQT2A_002425 [Pseudomonas aeruginosa]
MTESKICTCPSGDGSLRWPCPAHPEQQVAVAAKLTFINGRPAMCGCQVEYSDGGGEYSDVIYVTLCAKHSGSAILDLVATNRIALTPEYEGQWHADLYLDREIPLAKVEGATPAEAVLALMSAERIDPEQESVEQAGGDERAEFERAFTVQEGIYFDDKRGEYRSMNLCAIEASDAQDLNLQLQGWQARAALAQPSPVRSSLLINGYQLRAALDFIAPDGTAEQLESEACIEWRQQDADFLEAGLYAFCAEYPEEGGVLLDEEPTTAQPSPLQSEQAEAERPEVVAYFDRNYPSTGDAFIWSNYEGSPYEPVMTVSQHERIVGELRADRDSWAEQAEQRLADWDEMRKERDAALARVAELEKLSRAHDPLRIGLSAMLGSFKTATNPEQEGTLRMARQLLDATADARYGDFKNKAIVDRLIAGLRTPVAQAQQLNDLDKQCRDDVARALGLRPNQERGFAWSYLLASIKSCVKASGDSAQAQHSVPEEFSFEYRHPNGESHTVTVSRDQVINEMPDFLFEALCSKFCNCEPVGETNVVECCCDEYAEEFKLLAAAPAQAQHSVPEGWMLVPVEPLLNMMSDKDHDTRITAERQLLSILAAAPGKEVGHE